MRVMRVLRVFLLHSLATRAWGRIRAPVSAKRAKETLKTLNTLMGSSAS